MLNFRDAQILIVGAGVTGTSAHRVLSNMGAKVQLTDEISRGEDDSSFISLSEASSGHFDFAVISPGWKTNHPLIQNLQSRRIELISEVDLAWKIKEEITPEQKWIGITGTNGKTTTVELTTAILKEGGLNVTACGNVGHTVLDAVVSESKYEYLVVELSSFQLEWSRLPKFAVSAILNIADDHTDWHGGFEKYVQAKLRILNGAELAILNADDEIVVARTENWSGKKIFYTLSSPKPGEIGLVEELLIDRAFVADPSEAHVLAELSDIHPQAAHSVANTLAASSIARAVSIDYPEIQKAVQNFHPGKHRIETVHEAHGVKWIDDSKATNPHAAAASILSFPSVIWIAGGLAKGADMSWLVERISNRLKAAILIGTDRELIVDALAKHSPQTPIIRVDGHKSEGQELMRKVVSAARTIANEGDAVLLAPACASMDQFDNYSARGDFFKQAVLLTENET